MDAQKNVQTPTKIKRETKNKIRVEFDRASRWERFKTKYLTTYFLGNVVWYIFRILLLIGISYVILFPWFSKISSSFMSSSDFVDVTVKLIPRYPTLDTYKAIITENNYLQALLNTFILSALCAVVQTFICCLVGYGLAKYKFKGQKIVFGAVIFTMVVPHSTLQLSMFMHFRYFDVLGIFNFLGGGVFDNLRILDGTSINLLNSYWPLLILSVTALAFKNGLFIFLFRQFFKNVPDELEESAYVDGSGVFRTFLQIILPLSVPMLVTVFMFAFSWQWTDNFYTNLFFTNSGPTLMPDIVKVPASLSLTYAGSTMYNQAIINTCAILIVLPLVLIYAFAQKYIMQGIEHSGLTAD